MGFKFRKRLSLGPLRFNFGTKGFSSWGAKLGPWSWNSRTKRQRVDLPGPFSWEQKPRPRARKPRQARPVNEKYEQERRKQLRAEPRNLLPGANLLSALCSLGTVTFLLGGPFWAGLAGFVAGLGGLALTVRHVRRQRAIGRRGLAFLPYPGGPNQPPSPSWVPPSQQPYKPTHPGCRAKSAKTCRCPGRRRTKATRP